MSKNNSTKRTVLEIDNLHKYFTTNTNILQKLLSKEADKVMAVDGISLQVNENESHGIIGESGCGKSTLLYTLIGLYEKTGGDIVYYGDKVSKFDQEQMKEYRNDVQIVFQDPFDAFNPRMTIKESLMEPLNIHEFNNKKDRIKSILKKVELQPPERYLRRLPEQMSGGELQRAAIARALISEPDVILADEPTSMLDVSIQASILNTLSELTDDLGVSLIYISHDLSTVTYVCDYVHVMYLGRMVESGYVGEIINDPKHPYTKELMKAIPRPDPNFTRNRTSMSGNPQEPVNLGEGCRFRDRCPKRMDICDEKPKLVTNNSDRTVACHLYYDHMSVPNDVRQVNRDSLEEVEVVDNE